MRILVLGGGVAGLTAAYRLRTEHEVVVHEARDRPGGNIRTDELDGCLIEWGPNGFLDNEPATLQLIDELGLTPRLIRARADRRFIWRAGKLRELPSSPGKFLRSDCLPLLGRLRAMLTPLTRRGIKGDETIHAFVARRMGRAVADILVDAFVTGVFAGDPKRLSLKSAVPKIAAAGGSMPKGPTGTLTSFDEGLQVLIDTLAERVDLRLGEKAASLDRGDFDRVICTLPAPRAATLAPAPLSGLLGRIATAPVAVVAMIFDKALDVPNAFGFLAPHGQGLRILGVLHDSDMFEGRAPEGRRLFRVMVGGRRDPDAVALDDDATLELVAKDLRTVWGAFPDPAATRVIRHPLGIAQYEVGHAGLLEEIDAATPDWLRLSGASYRGVAVNACVKEALDWAP